MFTLNCKGRLLSTAHPLVMGIINTTPDSFYTGSRQQSVDAIVEQAGKMLEAGADILDIGGQSTRPGSIQVAATAEMDRVLPGVQAIHQSFPQACISIDTYHSSVAREAVESGASIVNDVSAGTIDPLLIPVVASLNVPYILMHMQGTLETMQQATHYENITLEVIDFFSRNIPLLTGAGIKDIIIDPGFGFGKTINHNFELIKYLDSFRILGRPLLMGISRKSTIYKTLGVSADQALNGSTVLHTVGLMKGASILRVHDVREAKEAIILIERIQDFR